MAGVFTNSPSDINNILTQEANRIGDDIHKATLHTSPWMDLVKQTSFPEGMGYELSTLVYDRGLPLKSGTLGSSPVLGVNWRNIANDGGGTVDTHTSARGFVDGSPVATESIGDEAAAKLDFTKILKSYSLKKAVVESPFVNVEDLRYAAHRNDQLNAIMDIMKESVRHTWENRYRDEYDRLADNTVICKSASTSFITSVEGKQSFAAAGVSDASTVSTTTTDGNATDIDHSPADGTADITGNISNAVMDKIYFQLIRAGAGGNAYGRENGRPIFSVVMSSEASYQLQTESGFRDDIRYNSAKVGDLIAPLGVEKSFRGFYHLVDDLTTRYTESSDSSNVLSKVEPYTVSGGVVVPNTAYESAAYEAAYILVDNVMESVIPQPITSAPGMTFDPVNYKGDFKWTNIPSVDKNPDGTIGNFRGIMASASKPIKTQFGYVVIFKRDTSTVAAV